MTSRGLRAAVLRSTVKRCLAATACAGLFVSCLISPKDYPLGDVNDTAVGGVPPEDLGGTATGGDAATQQGGEGQGTTGGNAQGGTGGSMHGGSGGMTGGGNGGSGGETTPECRVFVVPSAAPGGDGTTWARALASVQAGIDAAAAVAAGCNVWVAEGTYFVYSTAATDTLALHGKVNLYGGFAGAETDLGQRDWKTRATVLDGRASANGSAHVYHVVTAAADGVLDGFTVTGGSASTAPDDNGGGIYADGASPVIRNCTVTNNSAATSGGGGFFAGGSPIIEDSVFSSNTAGTSGGGVQLLGAAQMSRCIVQSNKSSNDAAGVGIGAGNVLVQSSVFYGNVAFDYSGGLAVGPDGDGARILNNTFYGNNGPHGGGGFSVQANGTVAANNVSTGNKGTYGANVLIFNGKTPTVHHTCSEGAADGTNNISANPQLIDPANANFGLQPTSPCIDQADDALAPPEDMAGGQRVDIPNVGVSVADIGAIEYRP